MCLNKVQKWGFIMEVTVAREEKKPLLSHEETLELIEKVQNWDEEAKEI